MGDLVAAARAQDVQAVRALIAEGRDVNAADEHGKRPLHYCAQGGAADAVDALVRAGADINAVDSTNSSALHVAVDLEKHGAVERLVALGADTNIRESMDGNAALHAVASYGQESLADLLLQSGTIDVNLLNDNHQTPLFVAASRGSAVLVQKLLVAGVDCRIGDLDDNTPLHLACVRIRAEDDIRKAVMLFKEHHADFNHKNKVGRTALHNAVLMGSAAAAKALVQAGTDLTIADHEGKTALVLAQSKGDAAMLAAFDDPPGGPGR